MRRLLPWVSLLLACAPVDTETLPASRAKSVVLLSKGLDGATAFAFAVTPFALPLAPTPGALIFEFDRTLAELGLSPGGVVLPAAAPRRSPLPSPLARFEFDGSGLHQSATTSVGLELPALDLNAVLQRGCLEAPSFVSSTCGATISFDAFQVSAAALPKLKDSDGLCQTGWVEASFEVDRGPSLGPLRIPYCAPPTRRPCAQHTMQAAGDARCKPVGAVCPQGAFPDGLPPGAVYVASNATNGDGSRARPFASLNEALNAMPPPAVIALGRGSYAEDVVLSGALDVLGACGEYTEILGAVELNGHQGHLRDLRIQGASVVAKGSSVTTLRGVEVMVRQQAIRVEPGASLRFEDGTIGPAGASVSVVGGRFELVGSVLQGHVAAESATVAIETSALTSTDAAEVATAVDTDLDVDRSLLGLPLYTSGTSRTAVRRSWIELSVGDGVHERNAIGSDGLSLVVEKSTFATREVLVPAPQTMEETAVGQVSIIPHTEAATVEDCLFLQAREESYAAVVAVSFSRPPQAAPYLLRRLAIVGGTKQGQIGIQGLAQLEDIGCYGGLGQAIFATEGALSVERVEVALSRGGLVLASAAPLQATLRDLRFSDIHDPSLIVRSLGASLEADVRRVSISSAPGSSIGLSIRADSPGANPRGLVKVLLRDLSIDAPIKASLELGLDAEVDLSSFSLRDAGTGILLHHRLNDRYLARPHHLSLGSITARLIGVELTDLPTDLHWLLDRVRLDAPKHFTP